jgi:protein-S-isoprenylcysteine O-methyltransferase Ste14
VTGRAETPGVIAPPPLIYLFFLLSGWGLGALLDLPGLGLDTGVRRGSAFILVIAGLLIDGVSAANFRRVGTAVEPWKPSTTLATHGLYAFSRNPIYVGFAITYVGFAIAMDSALALAFLIPCLLVIDRFVIQREERYLSARFGAEYESYRSRVRRWL